MGMTRALLSSWAVGLLALPLAAGAARADKIVLRGGGQIRGKVVTDKSRPDRVTVLLEKGKTPLVFEKQRVVQVVPEPSALDEYVLRRGQAPTTATGQYELGLWCEGQKLRDLAEVHYQAALALDKEYGPAHQKLGHVLLGDRWLTPDEVREAQGLVRYKGKWITKEEKEQRDARAATTAEQLSWARRIRLLRQAIASGPEDRRREAELQLMEIRDPVAVKPLFSVLGDDVDGFRAMLDRVLGEIPGPEAGGALAHRILAESDPDVRVVTMEQVQRRDGSEVVPLLLKALRAANPVIVNRAAWALGNLGNVAAVPKLIPALLTTQYQMVWVPTSGGGGGFNVSFGGPAAPTPSVPLAPMAYNGSSIGYLTPPAVGPGVAAFGATSGPALGGAPMFSAGTASGSRGPVPRLVTFTVLNAEVLAALTKLTGQDFGYDIAAWKHWLRTSFRPEPGPARRVPQP